MLPDGLPPRPRRTSKQSYTPATDCPTKDPTRFGRVVMATEQKEITPTPWAPAANVGAIFFLESGSARLFWLRHSAANAKHFRMSRAG
jgi:hypothetical protein